MIKYTSASEITLNVNNENRQVCINPSETLLYVLRNKLGLTGAKPGCENGDCGACTVLIDNMPVKSCLMLAVEAIGHKILTIEGLKNTPVQKAFVDFNAFQCGYCTSGFIMVCHSLALNHPNADDTTLSEWLQSNICRCTSYTEITAAAKSILTNK